MNPLHKTSKIIFLAIVFIIAALSKLEAWLKPLGINGGHSEAIAIMNRGDHETTFDLSVKKLGISSKNKLRDLWMHENLGQIGKSKKLTIPKHSIVVLLVS